MKGFSFQVLGYSLIFFLLSTVHCNLYPTFAVSEPLSVPNNRFGIHIIQATPDESSPAASLVNSTGGDWGYITVLIEGKDKNQGKWREFFNDLRRRHLIPLVRLATIPEGNYWKRPDIGEAQVWADFLDSLNWPTKNRYIIIYNEPNHAREWGQQVDAKSYARVLDETITALKKKNEDFFVLNAGIDASAPNLLPNYLDEANYLLQMEEAVPGIFNKLDGWVSHSYPNPAFAGSPSAFGKGTIKTYLWEIQFLKNLGVKKDLPIFITETGWKHAEGIDFDPSLPDSETLKEYYKTAFENAWVHPLVVAVTPFLLSYQDFPFDHFSFKKIKSNEYYSFFETIKNMPKKIGKPVRENKALLTHGEVYSSIVAGENYQISLTLKNTGQSIWSPSTPSGRSGQVKLIAMEGGKELGIGPVEIAEGITVEPGQEYTFKINLKGPQKGVFKVKLNLFSDGKQFDSRPLEFTTEVKLPVILKILTKLKWKGSAAGEYILKTSGAVGQSSRKVNIDENGQSEELDARYLLPDYPFEFELEKPYYKPKTIQKTLQSSENILDFGQLQPDILSALLNPKHLWKLLPFSN